MHCGAHIGMLTQLLYHRNIKLHSIEDTVADLLLKTVETVKNLNYLDSYASINRRIVTNEYKKYSKLSSSLCGEWVA